MSNPRELPILMNADMVRALLAGTKSQTRRPLKPQPPAEFCTGDVAAITNGKQWAISRSKFSSDGGGAWPHGAEPGIKPQYQIGDRLYVREKYQPLYEYCNYKGGIVGACFRHMGGGRVFNEKHRSGMHIDDTYNFKPSIHMPKQFARIWLEVVDVRVEQVDKISEIDAMHEGVPMKDKDGVTWYLFRDAFAALWDRVYFKKGLGWGKNPWVFVYEFKVVKPEVCNG